MSTEHQCYSVDNQMVAIADYAEQRGYEIVRTYADSGKSGLRVEGRLALQQLLDDVEQGHPDYEALLVYDVSRLGRFQDPDEAASHELQCRRRGIAVHYCAEQFENDGSIGSSIIKTVKRAMAGEYSRELSVKVFAGQSKLIRLGYRQGGMAGYAVRRLLVDQNGAPKIMLANGEKKSISTDRVILVPGPEEEVAILREIYRAFVEDGVNETSLAARLNAQGVATPHGGPWTRGTIHQMLTNEKYIGNNVWGKRSFKLKRRYVRNQARDWVRAEATFEPVVDMELFGRAQAKIAARLHRHTDQEMIEQLRAILAEHGTLSSFLINGTKGAPSSTTYRRRFGSLLKAYAMAGFAPRQDYRFLEDASRLRRLHPLIVDAVVAGIVAAGGQVRRSAGSEILTINDEFTASVILVPCHRTRYGSPRWVVHPEPGPKPDLAIIARMRPDNESAGDYFLLPQSVMRELVLRLEAHDGFGLDAYRIDTLEPLFALAARCSWRKAA
ncbi:recombinase family protein [Sphingosinicella sp. BN140058]|nr:recombinase family protein [Sphingosinicella sp. BN140058]